MPDSPDDASRRPPRPLTRPFRTPGVTRAVPAGPASDPVRRSSTAPFRAPFQPTPAGLPAQPQGAQPVRSVIEQGDQPRAATDGPIAGAAPLLLDEFRGTDGVSAAAAEDEFASTAEARVDAGAAGTDDSPVRPASVEAPSSPADSEVVPPSDQSAAIASLAAPEPGQASAPPAQQPIGADTPVEANAATVDVADISDATSTNEVDPRASRSSPAAEEWPEDAWAADAVGSEGDTGEFWTAGDPDLTLGARRADVVSAAATNAAFYIPTGTDERGDEERPASAASAAVPAEARSGSRPEGEPSAESAAYQPVLNAMNSPAAAAEWTRLTAGTPAEGTPMPLAEALEVLASRIRAGTLQASGYEPGMGDAAALTAALAAVLGVKR